jgi:ABC-2 type transport system permease protein
VSGALDDTTENVIHDSLQQVITGARLAAIGLDPTAVQDATQVERPNPVIVATSGEQQARRGFNRALPFIMGFLLFMGIMMGGQTLMASTIEEKSSRVVEVLLAAVSPLELMWGKLIGQLSVGLLVMAVYIGIGVLALFQFALIGLLDPMLILYLIVFFLLSYLVFGALMMSIGAAVNQMADAQSFMGPVMLLLIAPYAMAPVIGQTPNSTFSVVASFVPPVNTFAMLARLASSSPPPVWQVLLTIVIGIGAACATVWFAAKVFKVGLLMHGRPPSYGTLVRWVRMA